MNIHQYQSAHVDACAYHRLLLPARYCGDQLREEGVNIICHSVLPEDDGDFSAFMWHGVPPGHEKLIPRLTRWQAEGKRTIWSADDDYRCIPSWNPVKMEDSRVPLLHFSVRFSNYLVASTRTLADTFHDRPTHVCPNLLEIPLYDTGDRINNTGIVRVAYVGSNTHQGDLDQVVEAVTHVLGKYPQVEVVMYGCSHPEIRRRHLYAGVTEMPGSPLKDYWDILRSFAPDIWICPLADCDFSASKSCLKAIEGMALGAAVIASDVQPYRECIVSGQNGILVSPEDGGEEWTEALSCLIEDTASRKRMVQAGRDTVNERYNWQRESCRSPWMAFYREVGQTQVG